jgi:hypothetical protein
VLAEPGLGMCPSDTTLRLTTWWTVPLSGNEFVSWVDAHVPDGLHVDPNGGRSGDVSSFMISGDGTAAYTTPAVAVNFLAEGETTAVRLDTFIGARFARDTFVPGSTTEATIRRTRHFGDDRTDTEASRHVSDRDRVTELVAMANELPGVATAECVHSCPPTIEEGTYLVRFVGPEGEFEVSATDNACVPGATLRRNGSRVEPALDPDRSFFTRLDRSLRRR